MLKYTRIVEYNGDELDRYYYDRENNQLLLRTKSKRVKVIKPMKRGVKDYEYASVMTSSGLIKTYNCNDFMKKSKQEKINQIIIDREFTEEPRNHEEIINTFTK